jgi:hypothetical protein
MTAPPIDFWNAFHDGTIVAAEERDHEVRLFISIGYLRRRIQPVGGAFVVALGDVTACEFRHFDGEVTSLTEALDLGEPDILSTDAESFPAIIHTSLGQLVVAYGHVNFALDTGQPMTFSEIADAATTYWDEFEKRSNALRSQ